MKITKMLLKQADFLDFQNNCLNIFEEFCSFIEKYKPSQVTDFIQLARAHLLSIYNCGLQLSSDNVPSGEDYPDQLTQEDIRDIFKSIAEALSNDRYYWEIFDPTDETDKDPVCGDLIDDLADIYKDIKNSLLLFPLNTGEAKTTAMWQFEFQFRTHWGDHCINAIRACHYLLKE